QNNIMTRAAPRWTFPGRPWETLHMLYEPDRHEPLTEARWDEAKARACVEAILNDAIDRFSVEGFWPPHPLDGSPPEIRQDLYLGSAGTIWALNHLAAQPAFVGIADRLPDINHAWLDAVEDDGDPGLLSAGTGILLVQASLGGVENVADKLGA